MPKKKPPPKPIVCEVCGKTLHRGTTFCVSCGHHNTDVIERQIEISNQIERSMKETWFLSRMAHFFRFFRWF